MKNILNVFTAFFVVVTSTSAMAEWKYKKDVDDFDGDVSYFVATNSYSIEGDFFSVIVGCPEYQTNLRNVVFATDGILDFQSERQIRLKFDSNEPEYLDVRHRNMGAGDMISTNNIADFKNLTSKMQKHTTMKVEYYLYRKGRKIKTIDLTGFTKEFNKLPSHCQ